MNITTATKGQKITITYRLHKSDATVSVTGTFVSINSKGANVKLADNKIKSVPVARIVTVATPGANEYTTQEVADLLNIAAKELRVHLRALGMGVGKGRRYTFTNADVTKIRKAIEV